MVQLGIANSRMKDFFDIWMLSREQSFKMSRLRRAVVATFARRKTELPTERPTAFTDIFLKERGKAGQWTAFLRRMQLPKGLADLDTVGNAIAEFVMPVFEAARSENPEELEWSGKGPWKKDRRVSGTEGVCLRR